MTIYLPPLILVLTIATPPSLFAAAQTSSVRSADDANFHSASSFIVALLVSFLVFTAFVSIYIRNCYHDISDGSNSRYIVRASRLSETGLDPAVIDSFPIFDYSKIKHLKMGKEALSCAVCLLEFEDDETLRLLPKCDHVFHPECIDAWLASHFTCPICRADLSEKIESTQLAEERNSSSEVENENQISITVDENQRIDSETREAVRMFPRPHSTGHSLFQLGEDCERYTLRLSEEVRRQVHPLDPIVRSDRWVCSLTPPFFAINGPVTSSKATDVDGNVTPVGTSPVFLTSVKSLLHYPASRSEQMSPRLPV